MELITFLTETLNNRGQNDVDQSTLFKIRSYETLFIQEQQRVYTHHSN